MLTDGQTDGRTDGKPDPYIAPCLRQARQKWADFDLISLTYILYLCKQRYLNTFSIPVQTVKYQSAIPLIVRFGISSSFRYFGRFRQIQLPLCIEI